MKYLGKAYLKAGMLDKAVPLLEETVEKFRAKPGPYPLETLECIFDLARSYQMADRPAEAVPLWEELLKKVRAAEQEWEKQKAKMGPDLSDKLRIMTYL